MEDFTTVLKNIHTKLCKKKIPQRDPSHVPLSISKFVVSLEEIDHMFNLLTAIPEEVIREDEEVYAMIQDVFSCMRNGGITDSYLFLMFEDNQYKTYRILSSFKNFIFEIVNKYDYVTRSTFLSILKQRVLNFLRVVSLRDPVQMEEDNERYVDMYILLNDMMNTIYFIEEGPEKAIDRILEIQDARDAEIEKSKINDSDTEGGEVTGTDSEGEISGSDVEEHQEEFGELSRRTKIPRIIPMIDVNN